MANLKWTEEMFVDLWNINPRGQEAYQTTADLLNEKYNTNVKLENVKQQFRDILYTGGLNKFIDAFNNNKRGYSEESKNLIKEFYEYNPGSGGKSQGDPERQKAWTVLLDTLQSIEGSRKRYSTVRQYAQIRWGKRHENHSYSKPEVNKNLTVLKWPEYYFGNATVKCSKGHITKKSLSSLQNDCYFCIEDPESPCYLYYVEITDKDDKIGISKSTTNRWPNKKILREVLLTRQESYNIEQEILSQFDIFRTYCREIQGNGWTETLCREQRENILNYFDKIIDGKNNS